MSSGAELSAVVLSQHVYPTIVLVIFLFSSEVVCRDKFPTLTHPNGRTERKYS
jgi:hypothetical protein